MTDLNVNVAVDAGSHTSKLAYDGKIIAALENFDLIKLREEAEIFFDEPVFSCVVAVPESFNRRQREDVIFNAKRSGFKYVDIITAHDAIKESIGNSHGRILIYDFGASKSEFIIFDDNNEILDSEIISDVTGNFFDEIFSEWLSERFTLNLIDKKILLAHAEKIKISLSSNEFVVWRGVTITREDFERLIHFSIKRAFHTAERFMTCYRPQKFIITGGCAEIPLTGKIFDTAEFDKYLISAGTSVKARSMSKGHQSPEKFNTASKIRELRGELIELEEILTRKQKDRIYFLFRQAEGILSNDPAIINLLENLIREVRENKN